MDGKHKNIHYIYNYNNLNMQNIKEYIKESSNIIVKKVNKSFDKRKLKVYEGAKLLGEVGVFHGWISIQRENHDILRQVAMENLWWLLGKDCDEETWKEDVEYWDKGKRVYGVSIDKLPDSMFFEGEKEIALNSINNK